MGPLSLAPEAVVPFSGPEDTPRMQNVAVRKVAPLKFTFLQKYFQIFVPKNGPGFGYVALGSLHDRPMCCAGKGAAPNRHRRVSNAQSLPGRGWQHMQTPWSQYERAKTASDAGRAKNAPDLCRDDL